MKLISSLRRMSLCFVLCIVAAACGGKSGTTLVSIAVTPATPSITRGLAQSLVATATLSDGSTQDVSSAVGWTSSSEAVAIISASGVATAVGVGTSTISATLAAGTSVNTGSGPVSGSTLLTVLAPELQSVAVSPANPALELGANHGFSAFGTFNNGIGQDVTGSATWSSSDVTVLRLNNSAGRIGIANTRGPGTATVTATLGTVNGTTTATVTRRTPKFLYASNLGASTVAAFSVSPDGGALTAIGTPSATPTGSTSIAATRNFKFLYTANFPNNVSGFVIEADGSLTPVAGSPFPIANAPLSVVANPTADFLYVSTQGDGVTVLSIDPTSGTPTIQSSVSIGNTPEFGGINSDGSFFYQTVSSASEVMGFSVNGGSGALSALPGVPATTEFYPRALAIDPAGKFLYVVITSSYMGPSTAVDGFTIDAISGALVKIAGSPFDAGVNPVFATVDPSGRFLFVANNGASSVSTYSIDPDTGVLTEVMGSPFATPGYPLSVTVDPSGQYLYVGTDNGTADISGFTINQASGALTPNAAASGPGDGVWSIAVTY